MMIQTKYKSYPAYKKSGVEWIGEIPEYWEVRKLKWILQEPLKYGANESGEIGNNTQPRYIRITDINEDGNLVNDNVKTLPYGLAKDFLLKDGDILFARSGATVGKTFQFKNYNGLACFAGYLIKATPNKKNIDSDFLYYFTKSRVYIEWKNLIFIQATIQNIGADKYKVLLITLPPIPEQQAIADFLDRETARINGIVKKQTRMIELLKEKRSALITKAVTKGLDPHVKLKPSGVEWIGEIPEHWEIRRLKYLLSFLDNNRIPLSAEIRSGMVKEYPYYGASGIIDYVENYIFDEPLILIGEDGANLLYRSTPIAFLAEGKYWVNNHAHILKPMNNYIHYWINVLQSYDYIPNVSGSAQPKLTKESLGSIWLPLPPLREIQEIETYISEETARIDTLIEKIERQIELLNEYKQSLITSAVTGKIDVSTALNISVRGEANAQNS